jgi:hypothetical protein
MIVLVSRFVGTGQFQLHAHNWHYIVLVAFMLAQKFVDDIPLGNAEFVILADKALSACLPSKSPPGNFGVRFINYLEGVFLRTIHFDVFVKNKVYFEFLLELEEAFQRSFQSDNSSKDPLRTIQAHLVGLDSIKNSHVFAANQKKSSVDDQGIVECKGLAVLGLSIAPNDPAPGAWAK